MRYKLLIFIFLISVQAFAQLQMQKLPVSERIQPNGKISAILTDTLDLPFFEDFSDYFGAPDTTLWMDGSGVFVRQTIAITPVTPGVASFDGLNASGNPYDFNDNFPKGSADELVSKPINLSPYSANDSLYLSFFWQKGGLGELPDEKQGDSLVLEFKRSINDSVIVWDKVWGTRAEDSIPSDSILFQGIAITDANYLVSGFQFRFRNWGTLSGSYDNWHVDYVYLFTGRGANDRFFRDRSMFRSTGRLLKDFSSIPASHVHPDSSLSDYFRRFNTINVRTLDDIFSTYQILSNLFEDSTGTLVSQSLDTGKAIFPYPSINEDIIDLDAPAIDNFSFDNRRMYHFRNALSLRAHGDEIQPNRQYDARVNDNVFYNASFTDYYAYDDGSPELGAGIRTPFGKVAVEYALYMPDTMTGMQIMFIPAEGSITGTQIGLRVWSDLDRDVDPILYAQNIIGSYGDSTGILRVEFDSAVLCSDTVYIGWIQFDRTFLNVGYDMNSIFNDKIYTKVNPVDGWVNEADFEFPGSLMIRPIFGKVNVPIAQRSPVPDTKEEEKFEVFEMSFYPNPSKGNLILENACDSYEIYDLNGKIINSGSAKNAGDQIDLSAIPNGSYISSFIFEGQRSRKRIVILR